MVPNIGYCSRKHLNPEKEKKKQMLGGTGGGEREVEGKGEKKPMGGIKSKIFKRIIDP